jgi:hypothetical protein
MVLIVATFAVIAPLEGKCQNASLGEALDGIHHPFCPNA